MVGQVNHGSFIGFGEIFDTQFVGVVQRVNAGYFQVAGVILLHVGAEVRKFYPDIFRSLKRPGVPQPFIEPGEPTMQVIGPVVDGHFIVEPVDFKMAVGNPVSTTPDYGPEIGIASEIFFTQVLIQLVKTATIFSVFPFLSGIPISVIMAP